MPKVNLAENHFGDNFPTAKFQAALPLSRDLPRSAIIPLAIHDASTQTNLSIASPGAASNVRVTVLSRDGTILGFAPATIPANGRLMRPLSQWVPQAGSLAGGYVTVDSNQPIAAYALLAPTSGADYASLPAMPIPAGAVSPGLPPPGIAVEPASLDFGQVNVGQTRDLTVRVNNRGTAALTVNSIVSSNARFTHTQPSTPVNIGAGSFQNITIRFAPNAAGAQSGTLTINSTDLGQPAITVALTGSGVAPANAPALELTPLSLDFGSVINGQTKDLPVRVNNRGTAAANVTSITSSNARFTIAQPSTPFSIGPGSFQDFVVRFSPNAAGVQSGNLTVATTDPARPSFTVAVTGTGGNPGGGGGGGTSTQITPLSATGWPNLRISGNLPPAAIDGDVNTFTWTTEAFNTAVPSYLGVDLGPAKAVTRIRLYKDLNGGGGENVKNLVIQYTTSDPSIALPSRTWTTVTGLTNGFRGGEPMTAQSVNSDGTVTRDTHNSLTAGAWASLSFNRVNATGLRIGFQNPGGATFFNHYKVHELQVFNDEGTTSGPQEVILSVDDGSFENAIGIPDGAPLVYFVNRLTPPRYPATLRRIQVHFGNTATDLPAGHPVTVVFGNSSGSTNISGTVLQRINSSIAATGTFNQLTLTTPVTITSGDFVVGFSTSNPAGRYPATIDETSSRQRSYISTDGAAFTVIDQAGVPGNFAIRAVIDVP